MLNPCSNSSPHQNLEAGSFFYLFCTEPGEGLWQLRQCFPKSLPLFSVALNLVPFLSVLRFRQHRSQFLWQHPHLHNQKYEHWVYSPSFSFPLPGRSSVLEIFSWSHHTELQGSHVMNAADLRFTLGVKDPLNRICSNWSLEWMLEGLGLPIPLSF